MYICRNYQIIYMKFKSIQQMKILLLLYCLAVFVYSHYIHKVEGIPIEISSFTNRATSIHIPFKKCFKVTPELAANNKYLSFTPSSLKLSEIQRGYISQQKAISVLQDLRSPQTFTHQNLLVFNNYSLTFISPNTVQIIKEVDTSTSNGILNLDANNKEFKVVKKYEIAEIDQFTRFKMFKYNNNKALLFVYDTSFTSNNQKRIFLLDHQGYNQIQSPNPNYVSHLQAYGAQVFTAEFNNGIGCYKINQSTKKMELLANYNTTMFNNQNLYIVDVNIKSLKQHRIIYALDGIRGVYLINLTQSTDVPQVKLILNQPNCNAIDSIKYDHIVLACQLGVNSYIIEAYAREQNGTIVYQKLQPEYHLNYFNDLEINTNYYLVFSHKALNVYWSSKENHIPETVDTQSQLSLPGLQTFHFDINHQNQNKSLDSYLYSIQSGIMRKYRITQAQAKLTVKSSTEITSKQIKISIFGNCEDLPDKLLGQQASNLVGITCELQHMLNLKIVQENSPRKQDFSVSASIIVILIVVFLLIIWICLKKYKGLERQARKILENYKKKKPRQQLSL